ncbi:MAG: hypothetical protein KIH03_13595 [Paludibacteraceae bacterium]|nr:hypothetical protein [Paludibacteraceae bacterium]
MWGSLYGAGTGSVIGGVGSAMTGGDIKEGIIFGAATGLVSGGFQGYCSAKSQGLNPWTGKTQGPEYNKYILSDNGIYSTQKGLNKEKVSMYLEQMRNGTFDNYKISIMEHNGNHYITDGHSRITAAYRYYMETGDDSYIRDLINSPTARHDYTDPAINGYKNTHLWK